MEGIRGGDNADADAANEDTDDDEDDAGFELNAIQLRRVAGG